MWSQSEIRGTAGAGDAILSSILRNRWCFMDTIRFQLTHALSVSVGQYVAGWQSLWIMQKVLLYWVEQLKHHDNDDVR